MISTTTDLNIYYCDGLGNAEVVAHSFRELFTSRLTRGYLPIDDDEYKDLKQEVYWFVNNQSFIDIASVLQDYNLYISVNSMRNHLRKTGKLDEDTIQKLLANVQPVKNVEYEIDSNM